jgi:hypothetical protein
MTDQQMEQQLARITGEELHTIQQRGFNLLQIPEESQEFNENEFFKHLDEHTLQECEFGGQTIDWDDLDSIRISA